MPYTFVAELPEITVRDGMFFVDVGERTLTFTPHMFLATVQSGARSYRQWAKSDGEVIPMQAGGGSRH